MKNSIFVSSEVGRLRRLIIHSPDEGIGKVIPTKAQEWLFEDIVHLETMRRREYDLYLKLLLYFLDYEKIHGRVAQADAPAGNRNFYKPDKDNYFQSDRVLETQFLLSQVLEDRDVRNRLIASVCAHEETSYRTQELLQELSPKVLSRTLISGILPEQEMIFPPIPNFIFTRDIGITVKDHIIFNKPAKEARTRESILTKHILFNHPLFAEHRGKLIEVTEEPDFFLLDQHEQEVRKITLEGGDIMMVAPNHLLVGVSERTSLHAASKMVRLLHERDLVEKVTVIKIPAKRAYMHIDTTFTQVKRNMWVMFGMFSKEGIRQEKGSFIESLDNRRSEFQPEILQYIKGESLDLPIRFEYLEDLLDDISRYDLNSKEPTRFIYSGHNLFPYNRREQWTDSCNVLALKEGVVIGYDRNDKTAEAFREQGMRVVQAQELLEQFEREELHPDQVEDTLILLPSSELSRARGGPHCMSMPILRDPLF